MPNIPLDYRNEVVTGLTLDEAQALARPCTLSPLEQEFVSWSHRLYHLTYRIIFWLASLSFPPKLFLECQNKPSLCVACQFVQAHCCPWQTKGKRKTVWYKDRSKQKPQIVSSQPGLIPQMSGFLTNQRLWGATTFVDHVKRLCVQAPHERFISYQDIARKICNG